MSNLPIDFKQLCKLTPSIIKPPLFGILYVAKDTSGVASEFGCKVGCEFGCGVASEFGCKVGCEFGCEVGSGVGCGTGSGTGSGAGSEVGSETDCGFELKIPI
jgi:hypothetical protein